MLETCPGCLGFEKILSGGLCLLCEHALTGEQANQMLTLQEGNAMTGLCLYSYSGIIRRLTVRAKFSHDHRALRFLTRILLRNFAFELLLQWCHRVVAVPSSRMGRFRGQYDLVAYWVGELGKNQSLNIQRWPYKSRLGLETAKIGSAGENILIIDDVITTGATINRIRMKFKQCCQFRFAVLAARPSLFLARDSKQTKITED